jgi:hypothetical protein
MSLPDDLIVVLVIVIGPTISMEGMIVAKVLMSNQQCSWTGTVGPSLPGFTIAPCVDSLLFYMIVQPA